MEQIKVLIVDDEEFARSSLYFLLQNYCPEVTIKAMAKSVVEAKNIIKDQKIDLVFLDIAMPNENGFSLIPIIQEKQLMVIFTTAYDQYAIKAIKANALDYLLKPIDIEELKEAVAKSLHQKELKKISNQFNQLKTLEEELQNPKSISKITISSNQGHRILNVDDIVYIEADSNYCIIVLSNLEQIMVSKILKEYEEVLPDDQFLRIHKSVLVNTRYIRSYQIKNGLTIILENGTQLPVSRRRSSELLERIKTLTIHQ